MSLRTTGSITVERVAKPLKNYVLSKDEEDLTESKSTSPLWTKLKILE